MSAVLAISTTNPLEDAVRDLVAAKRAEDAATKARVAIEERILARHPAKAEGSETIEVGGFKLTTTGKLTYKCDDPKALAEFCAGKAWPGGWVPVKTEVKLDETGAKWLRANEPGLWAQLAPFVTVKPAKTSITVKV